MLKDIKLKNTFEHTSPDIPHIKLKPTSSVLKHSSSHSFPRPSASSSNIIQVHGIDLVVVNELEELDNMNTQALSVIENTKFQANQASVLKQNPVTPEKCNISSLGADDANRSVSKVW